MTTQIKLRLFRAFHEALISGISYFMIPSFIEFEEIMRYFETLAFSVDDISFSLNSSLKAHSDSGDYVVYDLMITDDLPF
ncbi:hypothetical protein [Peromfec virus RodF8_8]|uniref:Uncharacterized protein n=1 Tax=Peromfec virus RodF8_8 TaxID=2929389 RepID=A0A976N2A2_9VIRU|nr:hypothetical protein [Peromfec virus RodF8_8]